MHECEPPEKASVLPQKAQDALRALRDAAVRPPLRAAQRAQHHQRAHSRTHRHSPAPGLHVASSRFASRMGTNTISPLRTGTPVRSVPRRSTNGAASGMTSGRGASTLSRAPRRGTSGSLHMHRQRRPRTREGACARARTASSESRWRASAVVLARTRRERMSRARVPASFSPCAASSPHTMSAISL
jgi:hypothetical protein